MKRIKVVLRTLLSFALIWGGVLFTETSFAEPIGIVSHIEIHGTEELFTAENVSLDKLETKIGRMAHTSAVERDMQALYDSGYFAKVSSYAEQRSDGIAIVFEVQSNPVLQRIVFEGVSPEHENSLRSLMKTKTETVFNRNFLAEDANRLTEWLVEQGYPAGRMTSYRLSSAGTLYLVVNKGVVGDVSVLTKGHEPVADLLRVVELQEGDTLTDNAIEQSVERLATQPNVKSVVDVRLSRVSGSGLTNVTFIVEEAPTGRYEIGAGYNTSDGFLAYGNISEQQLLGTDRSLTAKFRLSQRNNLFDVQYSDGVLCSRCWDRWNLNVYRRFGLFGRNQEHEETMFGLSTSIDKTIASSTIATVGATFNSVHDGIEGRRLVALEAGMRYDQDNLFLKSDVAYALPALGSQYKYFRTSGTIGVKQPIGPGNLTAMVQLGHIQGDLIPQSLYFRAGGPGTLRGYPFAWKRGERMMAATVEYAVPVWGVVAIGAFVDVADAVDIGERFSPKMSAGVGIRVDTPIGLLKLDYASGESGKMRLVFGVGTEW